MKSNELNARSENPRGDDSPVLPANQALVGSGKWPVVGERKPRQSDEPWAVSVSGLVERDRVWALDELAALCGGYEQTVDIHCVTRWSKLEARFGGVPLKNVLEACGLLPSARFVSFIARSDRNHSTSLPIQDALSLKALVAFTCDGEALTEEHGGPVRMVVPGRYFYKSLKWLERIELLEDDRLGYWEAETGYHNNADPWQEERYAVPNLDRREVMRLFESKDFSGKDLRSLEADHMELVGLDARGAMLRDARFRKANLRDACFDGANLSNAHFESCDLRGATFRRHDELAADLEGADFRGADLRGVIFESASCFGASFCDEGGSEDSNAAIIDSSTKIDPKTIETLDATPTQKDFVIRALGH